MKTLKKGLDILNSFTKEFESQGVTEISKKLGYNISTTHALLQTLKQEGYVLFDHETKKYSLGYKTLDLAGRISYPRSLREISYPIMKELADNSGEDIALNLLIEDRRVTIETLESQNLIRHIIPIGKALPLHCSAAGKTLMAYLSLKRIDEIVMKYGLPKFTPYTLTKKDKLLIDLNQIRRKGYGESHQEYSMDGVSIAFPIFNKRKEILASLSIHSTINRLNEKYYRRCIKQGLDASKKINETIKDGLI